MDGERRHEAMELVLGNLLRAGVALAAIVVLTGAVVYLGEHGFERADYQTFRIQPPALCGTASVLRQAASFDGAGLIQLGVLLLIATPIARVAISACAFARAGDRRYVVITLVVLGVLSYGLLVAK